MSKQTKLTILDEVNVKFSGLDVVTRKKMVDAVKFFLPYAYHLPAYKLGRWDGTVSYCSLAGQTQLNLLDKILPIVMGAGYEIEIDDLRESYDFNFSTIDEDYHESRGAVWPKGHPAEGQTIKLRDYQVEVINNFTENLQCIQEIATGAGKTIMSATLSSLVEPYGRSVVIVPNKSLVVQTEADYKLLGLDVGVYFGDRKELGKQHTICTWQSLDRLEKLGKGMVEEDKPLNRFAEGVVCIMVDECLAPGTLIRTPSGFSKIEDLKPGDKVVSMNEETGEFGEDTVVKLHVNLTVSSSEDMYEIEMEDGRILHITGNHKVYTNNGWKMVKELTEQDEILTFNE